MKSRLLQQSSLAGAVAREIIRAVDRNVCVPTCNHFSHVEGVAYKAEWDRRGSDAMKHCAAFGVDCAVMEIGVREGHKENVSPMVRGIDADLMVTP